MVVRPFIEFEPDQPANLICLGLLFSTIGQSIIGTELETFKPILSSFGFY